MTREEMLDQLQALKAEHARLLAQYAEREAKELKAKARFEANWQAWGSDIHALKVESYSAPASHGKACMVIRRRTA